MILNVNDVGPPVRACQDALHSALGTRATNAQNGTYGHAMADDVKLFRTDVLRVPAVADGLMLDQGTIDALAKYMDASRKAQLDKPLTTNVAYDAIVWNQGDDGPPIGAMQNALWSALGSEGVPATNARNGSYGSNTAADLRELGQAKHMPIPADGRGCSYLAWQVCLEYMNQANRQNASKPLGSDVKAGQYVYLEGSEGPPIAAMQAALASILGPGKTQNARNAVWGSKTTADLLAARQKGNLTPVGDGSAVDKLTWDWLYSYMNSSYQAMCREPLTKDPSKPPPKPAGDLGKSIAAAAIDFYNRCHASYTYAQIRAMPSGLYVAQAKNTLDCSSSSTLIYKEAGAPDPNGRGYDGYGYTGSLWPEGTSCEPKDGALAFYGGSGGNDTTHVAVVTDGGRRVVSFGHTPIEYYSQVAYRSDYRGCKEYV